MPHQPTPARTITGTTGVWLTEYSGIKPADLISGAEQELVDGVQFATHDMAPKWIRIGDATITMTLAPNEDLVAAQVAALREAQRASRAAAAAADTDFDRQIQQLLAISYQTAEVQP